MEEIFEEYVTFHVTASDGSDVEMAVVDEFDFEDKHYVVGAVLLRNSMRKRELIFWIRQRMYGIRVR